MASAQRGVSFSQRRVRSCQARSGKALEPHGLHYTLYSEEIRRKGRSNGATSGYSTFHYPPSTDLLIPLWTDISFTVFFVDSLTSLVRSIYDQDVSTATSTTAPQQTPLPPGCSDTHSQSGKHPAGQAAIGQRTRLLTDMDKLTCI
jgi:hypothetical protein